MYCSETDGKTYYSLTTLNYLVPAVILIGTICSYECEECKSRPADRSGSLEINWITNSEKCVFVERKLSGQVSLVLCLVA